MNSINSFCELEVCRILAGIGITERITGNRNPNVQKQNTSDKLSSLRKHKHHRGNIFATLLLIAGILFIINGYFAFLYPQTYYTYKISPLTLSDNASSHIDYHVTDKYIGDKTIKLLSDTKYEYALIATREISRHENRYLMTVGFTLMILSAAWLIQMYISGRKKHQTP